MRSLMCRCGREGMTRNGHTQWPKLYVRAWKNIMSEYYEKIKLIWYLRFLGIESIDGEWSRACCMIKITNLSSRMQTIYCHRHRSQYTYKNECWSWMRKNENIFWMTWIISEHSLVHVQFDLHGGLANVISDGSEWTISAIVDDQGEHAT